MTIRLVGRSMCSQAASALDMPWDVLMCSTLDPWRPARIRDKYGRDHAAVADAEAWPPAETCVDGHRTRKPTALDVERLDRIVARSRAAADAFRQHRRPGGRRSHRLGARGRRPAACGRAGPARDGGDRVRRLRGQGGQELHRHRVPLRLPEGQAVGRRHRGGPRAGDPLRRGACRRGARADADHQPDLDRAVQGDRRGQDAQRRHLPPVGASRGLRDARRRDPPGGRRARRDAAGDAAGHPRPDARRLPVPLPPPRRRLHLDDRRPEGGRRGQRGRQAVPERRRRQRAGLHPLAAPTCRWPSSTC